MRAYRSIQIVRVSKSHLFVTTLPSWTFCGERKARKNKKKQMQYGDAEAKKMSYTRNSVLLGCNNAKLEGGGVRSLSIRRHSKQQKMLRGGARSRSGQRINVKWICPCPYCEIKDDMSAILQVIPLFCCFFLQFFPSFLSLLKKSFCSSTRSNPKKCLQDPV